MSCRHAIRIGPQSGPYLLGCQKEIAQQIRAQKGHDVLALKGNQAGLQKDMPSLFDQGINNDFAGLRHAVSQTNPRN